MCGSSFDICPWAGKLQLLGTVCLLSSLCLCVPAGSAVSQKCTLTRALRSLEAKASISDLQPHVPFLSLIKKSTVKAFMEVNVDWQKGQFSQHLYATDMPLLVQV